MRLPIIFILFLSLLTSLAAQRSLRGSGNVTTEDRSVTEAFERIEATRAIIVEVQRGDRHAISVKADDNLQQYIVTEVRNGTLRAYLDNNKNYKSTSKMIVYVTTPELTSIEASGASRVVTNDRFEGDEMYVDVSGAAQVRLDFVGRELKAEVGGAGQVELRGSADEVHFEADSAGSLRAKGFTAKVARVEASSAASIQLRATREIHAEANSASSIRYEGNPERVFTEANSAATIKEI